MAYFAYAVANAVIEKADQGRIPNLTPMTSQMLLYFAQAWHLKGVQLQLHPAGLAPTAVVLPREQDVSVVVNIKTSLARIFHRNK